MFSIFSGGSEKSLEGITIKQKDDVCLTANNLNTYGTIAYTNDGYEAYIDMDGFISKYANNKNNPEKLRQLGAELIYNSYCELYKNQKNNWDLLLSMNNQDYFITILSIIDQISKERNE